MPKGKYDHNKIKGRKRPEHSLKLKKLTEQGKHPFQRADREKQAQTLKKRYKEGLKNPMKGKKRPDNILRNKLRNQKGKNNGNWKGDKAITPIVMRLRMSWKYRQWRSDVFERDNFICIWCGQVGGKLNADHIKPFSHIIKDNNIKIFEEGINCEELWNINNGRTLCFNCHKKTKTFANKARKKDFVYPEEDVKEFIKIIEKRVMDYRMYADMCEDEFWASSTISPQDAEKRAKYCEELLEEIYKLAGEKLNGK